MFTKKVTLIARLWLHVTESESVAAEVLFSRIVGIFDLVLSVTEQPERSASPHVRKLGSDKNFSLRRGQPDCVSPSYLSSVKYPTLKKKSFVTFRNTFQFYLYICNIITYIIYLCDIDQWLLSGSSLSFSNDFKNCNHFFSVQFFIKLLEAHHRLGFSFLLISLAILPPSEGSRCFDLAFFKLKLLFYFHQPTHLRMLNTSFPFNSN